MQLPRAQRASEIRALLLESLMTPVDNWSGMTPPEQRRYVTLAEELAEELLRLADSFVQRVR